MLKDGAKMVKHKKTFIVPASCKYDCSRNVCT